MWSGCFTKAMSKGTLASTDTEQMASTVAVVHTSAPAAGSTSSSSSPAIASMAHTFSVVSACKATAARHGVWVTSAAASATAAAASSSTGLHTPAILLYTQSGSVPRLLPGSTLCVLHQAYLVSHAPNWIDCGLTNRYDRQTAWQHQGIWRAALARVSESGGHCTVRLLTMHSTHLNRHLQAAAIQAKTDATLAQYLNLPDNAITLITQRAPDCFPVLAHCNFAQCHPLATPCPPGILIYKPSHPGLATS